MDCTSLKPGQRAIITGYQSGSTDYKHRLLAMGLTRGAVIELVKVAPMGDPIELKVRGYNLSLRKAEASILQLEAAP